MCQHVAAETCMGGQVLNLWASSQLLTLQRLHVHGCHDWKCCRDARCQQAPPLDTRCGVVTTSCLCVQRSFQAQWQRLILFSKMHVMVLHHVQACFVHGFQCTTSLQEPYTTPSWPKLTASPALTLHHVFESAATCPAGACGRYHTLQWHPEATTAHTSRTLYPRTLLLVQAHVPELPSCSGTSKG